MTTEIAATEEGEVAGRSLSMCLADHGAFDACADPSKWPAGFFNIVTGSYDFPTAHVAVDGIYADEAPGGVAYRCWFQVTEAAYCVEHGVTVWRKLQMDPAELRLKNFIKPEQFPYHSALGSEYDSGDYHTAMKKMMESVDYAGLGRERLARAALERSETHDIMGIGVSFFPRSWRRPLNWAFLGITMFDSCEIRMHPTSAVVAQVGFQSHGPTNRRGVFLHRDRARWRRLLPGRQRSGFDATLNGTQYLTQGTYPFFCNVHPFEM